ncbi:MAG TPA: YidB family protein [Pseudolabrys sp.]
MGLIDVLNGMQNGPHGQREPNANPSAGSSGMSPITMAILGLLAYKAVKSFTGSQQPSPAPANPRVQTGAKPTSVNAPESSGGLSDLMKGGLGGLLAGGAAGSILSGGLNDLLKQFQQNGQGDAVDSWVGTGPNKPIPPKDLANALGADKISTLSSQTGMSRDDLLNALSQYLPQAVDRLTPQGRLPTEQEAQRMF